MVRLVVRYDGSDLSGWQRQRGVPTVQEHLETAASAMACERVTLRGAGRTDAGVHALGQLAAFRTLADIPERGWRLGLNARLPSGIAVTDARIVSDDFDPRLAVAGKRYRYLLLLSPNRDPLLHRRAWHLYQPPDLSRMGHEATELVGIHDFAAFRAADCDRATTVRQIFKVQVSEGYTGRPDLVAITVEGTGFLKNMVRIIVGTLVDVGRGKLPVGTVRSRLTDRDRTHAGVTAPPQGLYLDTVFLHDAWRFADDPLPPRPDYPDAVPSPRAVDTPVDA